MCFLKRLTILATFSLLLLPQALFAAPLENPLTKKASVLSLAETIGLTVKGLLGFSGVLAVVFIIIGGIRVIAASGNEEQVKQGTQTLLWAVLGLVVAFVGYIVVGVIVDNAGKFFGS
ncbi:MAG: hypothetical protein HY461_01410 [Parcubacteria group bacterium]|nr:hypothetical protein [Parcubacteria group bacterium]